MTSAELKEKLAAAEQKVEKIKGTIERHKKQAEKKLQEIRKAGANENDRFAYRQTEIYWTICDYESKLEDIKSAESKLKDAEIVVRNWNSKLEKEKVKNETERIPVIEEFLERWKVRVIEWYKMDYVNLKKVIKIRQEKQKQLEQWRQENKIGYYYNNPFLKEKEKELGIDKPLMQDPLTARLLQEKNWEQYLEKEIEKDKNNKRALFVYRVKEITGTIQNASALTTGGNGEINGIVIGEKGKAKVETISAGGYNIQCWHFRVLVKEVK